MLLIYKMVNINRYNPHEEKFFGGHRDPETKKLENHCIKTCINNQVLEPKGGEITSRNYQGHQRYLSHLRLWYPYSLHKTLSSKLGG